MQLPGSGFKGPLIFEVSPAWSGIGPTHAITLADSNRDKTLATPPGTSPPWDSGDSYIGFDGPTNGSNAQVAFGAGTSISQYIDNPGDNVNYLERLTAAQKIFRVPVQFDGTSYSSLTNQPNGTFVYCVDCKNIADDGVTFDSDAAPTGHGTSILRENGHWRVH